ncbi:MAG: hypothetical protein AAB966_04050 [Patescibacteria group bacterium]
MKFLKLPKRIRFVISTVLLGFLMLVSTFFYFDRAWIAIPILLIATYALTYFSILEGIERVEWLTLFTMPVLLTLSFYVFYFLFPARWLTRLPFIVLYMISIYANLLASNIFNVGVERNLQLYRAAFSVNYFYQTVISFLFFNILFSLREYFFVNAIGTGVVVFLLALQLLWTIRLNLEIKKELFLFASLISLVMFQIATLISFIPLKTTISSLFLTSSYYSFAGLTTAYLDSRLFKNTIREFIIVFLFVIGIAFLTLSW